MDIPLFNIFKFMKDPEHFQHRLLAKWQDPFPMNFPGFPKIWLTQNPLIVKKVFTAPLGTFTPSHHNPVAPLLGINGLILLGGDEHSKSRKDLSPTFMGSQLKVMNQAIKDIFFEISEGIDEGTLELQSVSASIALRIILRLLFPHLPLTEMVIMEDLTNKFLKSYSASLLFIPKWMPWTWSIFNSTKKNLDECFWSAYLEEIKYETPGALRTLKESNLSKEEVLDQIRTMVVAGHETTATSLVWTLYLIHQKENLRYRDFLMKEICYCTNEELIETLPDFFYLEAIVNESLRLHPPVPFITRKVMNPFELGHKGLRKEEECGVSILLLHRNPLIWRDPLLFSPERFLQKKYGPHEFAPFGGSNRKCIGAGLAMLELKILTALFLKEFHLELISDESIKPKVMQITIGPKKAIIFKIRKRKNPSLPHEVPIEAQAETFSVHSASIDSDRLNL